jgi:hypothetical protein
VFGSRNINSLSILQSIGPKAELLSATHPFEIAALSATLAAEAPISGPPEEAPTMLDTGHSPACQGPFD